MVSGYQTTRPVSEDKSARKRGLVGPYVKTTRTVWKDYSDHQSSDYWYTFQLSRMVSNYYLFKHCFCYVILHTIISRFTESRQISGAYNPGSICSPRPHTLKSRPQHEWYLNSQHLWCALIAQVVVNPTITTTRLM
jgi:hypothetical protein